MLFMAARTEGQGEMLASIVGTGFVLFGVVMVVLGLKSALIVRLPEIFVELDGDAVRAGTPFRLTVRQPGRLWSGS